MRLREQVFSAQVVCVLAGVLVAFHRVSGQSGDRCSLTFGYTSGGQPVAPQTSPSPFKITVSPKQYSPNSVVTVTIESSINFREIVLQARTSSEVRVGTWQTPPSAYQLLTCTNAGDTLTNTNNDLKSPIQFQWTAPSSGVGYVRIVASVAISNDVFWTGHTTAIEDLTATVTSVCTNSPCANGICQTESPFITRSCSCDSAYEGENCDRIKYNPYCPDNTPCGFGGNCFQSQDNPGVFVCGCRSQFQGSDCTVVDLCQPNPCMSGGSCSQTSGQFSCSCPPNFTGTRCETGIVVNPCQSNPCMNGGACFQTSGQFRCNCPPNFTGTHCEAAVDPCQPNPCMNGGACFQAPGQFRCSCTSMFTGTRCETANPCNSSPCRNSGTCTVASDGSFTCTCASGYSGTTCGTIISHANPCNSSPCLNSGTCTATASGSSFTCSCASGYSGTTCDQGSCSSSPCQNNAACTDIGSVYTCTCLNGYDGIMCQRQVNCSSTYPCANQGTCNVAGQCICAGGYLGDRCENANCAPNPCQNGGTCSATSTGYTCSCANGYDRITCSRAVNCSPQYPCLNQGTCDSNGQCTCTSGFSGNRCQTDMNSCVAGETCLNGGSCIASSDKICKCANGYTGTNCEMATSNFCTSSPCKNNAACISLATKFTCACRNGYTGVTCSTLLTDPNLANNTSELPLEIWWIALIGLIGLLFIVIVVAVLVTICRSGRSEDRQAMVGDRKGFA